MSASGEKTARILWLPLTRESHTPQSDHGDGDAVGWVMVGVRVVAFLAALLFAFAVWMPWVVIVESSYPGSPMFVVDGGWLMAIVPLYFAGPSAFRTGETEAMMRIAEILRAAWPVVSGSGVLLAPLLWLRPHTRYARLALTAYGVWLLLASAFTLALARVIFFPLGIPGRVMPVQRPGIGFWLAVIALVAGVAAVTTLVRYDWSRPRISARGTRAIIARTRAGWVGIGLMTAGILLWELGFMAIPWATVNCPITPLTVNHFVSGRCAALDSGDALTYFATRTLARETWNLAGGIYPLYGMLIGGGLFVLIALWRTSPSRAMCTWAVLWLLGASVVAYLAYRGVGVILTVNPAMSDDARGAWVGANGVTTTLLGLLLAWLGIIPLEYAGTQGVSPPAAFEPSAVASDAPLHLVPSERDDDELDATSLR